MPHSKQALKRHVQSERRRLANKSARTAMKTAIKKVLGAETKAEAEKLFSGAVQHIDKAAKNRVIHPNAAARTKSRIARKVSSKT